MFKHTKIAIKYILPFAFIIYFCIIATNVFERTKDKDYAIELISNCNYSWEVHRNIKTGDGYLLTMHRITGNGKVSKRKTPVLLMHGLLGSAESFLFFDCKSSLSYMLVEQGYDVWLGNGRTVSYSRYHQTLDPDSAQYWDTSLDDYGTYDLPALIDYILKRTGHQQLMYVGHSQGNMIYYIMCSNKQHYADKVQLFVNLSPVALMSHQQHPWSGAVCSFILKFQEHLNKFGFYEWTFGRDFIRKYGRRWCSGQLIVICKFILYSFSGISPDELHNEDFDRYLTNSPEGISAKQLYHLCQMHARKQFMKFDYGSKEANSAHYDSVDPPEYNLTKTTTPVAIYYAKNDWILAVEDVELIVMQLPNVVELFEIQIDNFSHLDYIIGRNAPTYLYPRLIQLMNTYQNKRE